MDWNGNAKYYKVKNTNRTNHTNLKHSSIREIQDISGEE